MTRDIAALLTAAAAILLACYVVSCWWAHRMTK